MIREEELRKRTSELSDEELYKMLYVEAPENWTPLALRMAQNEWEKRAISPGRFQNLGGERASQEKASQEPLVWRWRAMAFILPFFLSIIGLAYVIAWARRNQLESGHERRFRECMIFMSLGFVSSLAMLEIVRWRITERFP